MVTYRCEYNVGEMIDHKYHVDKILGTGSYGNVYKVTDRHGNVMALKLLRLWDVQDELRENLIKRFNLEYATAKIDSPYFVHSYEMGEIAGNPYFTMEFCSSGDLSGQKSIDDSMFAKIAHDILKGLLILHNNGLVHRDLKPENVMVKNNGSFALTDFGIVGDKQRKFTQKQWWNKRPKQVFGTYIYMAPEQNDRVGGGVTYLPTTDIFSFGVLMYELLTKGKYPFGRLESEDDLEIYLKRARKGQWDTETLNATQSGQKWHTVIKNCLYPDYKMRYQSVEDVLNAIPIERKKNYVTVRSGAATSLVITLGDDIGKTYILSSMLNNNRRMLKVGREDDNDIVLSEKESSYISRYHCTLELDADNITWYIRDGQWRPTNKAWISSTNGTYINSSLLTSAKTKLFAGDIITIGNLKMIVK